MSSLDKTDLAFEIANRLAIHQYIEASTMEVANFIELILDEVLEDQEDEDD